MDNRDYQNDSRPETQIIKPTYDKKGFNAPLILLIFIILLLPRSIHPQSVKTPNTSAVPGKHRQLSWNRQKLNKVQAYSQHIGTAAFILMTGGKIIRSWGDLDKPFIVHSMRKALLSAVVGCHTGKGPKQIDPDASLADLDIDDSPNPLTDLQRQATVLHLIKSISGINHRAAAETAGMVSAKNRLLGHKPNIPGSKWAYNNWDYNVLTSILEKQTGMSVYQAFKKSIAEPLEMQDFNGQSVEYVIEENLSRHTAAAFRMTARDLAKFGRLYLNNGRWNGKQVIPPAWIDRITGDYVITDDRGLRSGHGYLWWVPDDLLAREMGVPEGSYMAAGFAGQRLVVIPAWDTVIVHQVNTLNYDACFEEWAKKNGYNIQALEDAVYDEAFSKFINDLVKCKDNPSDPMCGKCRFVTGGDFSELLKRIIQANTSPPAPLPVPSKSLHNLHYVPKKLSNLGCLEGCLDFLGIKVSDPWLWGATGYAFVLNINENVDLSCTGAWNDSQTYLLGKNLGFLAEKISAHVSHPDFRKKQRLAWDSVRSAIDNKIPVFGFDLLNPSSYVIFGYDDKGYYFKGPDRMNGTGPRLWKRLGVTPIGRLSVYTVKPCPPAPDAKTVKDAFLFALEHSRGPRKWIFPRYRSGSAGYDLWIQALIDGNADPRGVAMTTAAWAECRRYAVAFLKEARGRFDNKLRPLFDEAILWYHMVSQNLDKVALLFPYENVPFSRLSAHVRDPQRCRKAAQFLFSAKKAEEAGLKVLEKIAHMLE